MQPISSIRTATLVVTVNNTRAAPRPTSLTGSDDDEGLRIRRRRSCGEEAVMKTMVIARAVVLSMMFAASCATPSPGPANVATTSTDPGPAPSTATLSATTQKGIEAGDVNRSVDPCTDFYEYANGTWRAQNPVPAGKSRWSRRGIVREANQQKVDALIQELAAKTDWPAGSPEQLVGDHYASCMDEAAIEAAGISPIAPLLADIDAAKTPADVQRAMRRLLDLGIAAPLGESGAYDNREPKDYLLNLVAGGLGLPDRDAYLKPEPRFVEMRSKYRQHVARVLALGGMAERETLAAADRVIALEKRLAEASLDAQTAGDAAATEHKTTFAQLKGMAPRVEWDKYFDEAEIAREPVNVAEPKFLRQVDKEFKTTPVAAWRTYLRWRLLAAAAPWLSKAFAEEAFAFNGKTLGGATEMTPRARRCAALTETLLGESVGRKYADKYFPPAAKAKARELVNGLVAVMKESLSRLSWMATDTKRKAIEKLELMSIQVGYPDEWKDTSKVQIRRDALWTNIAQARKLNIDDVRRQAGKPTNRNGWTLPPSSSGAYIDAQLNEIVLPAGFLQPPYFDIEATDAKNYGALGAGLAHDMTHTFDGTGALLDAAGRAQPWWTDSDQTEFQKRAQCIVDQYEGYSIEPGVHHQGKTVLPEALGDQAGVHFAYLALKKSMATRPVPTVDGFTPEQQFFLAYGQFRGEAMPIETQRQIIKGGTHPVPKFRVLGPLSNLPGFAQAFSCTPGASMVRPPEMRCVVW
jgi:endothelin-converting enzyme/putative endopeptidase